ncbi:MAG: protein-glutamate O-methyltransferase CheR [Candidatus Bathyarchaeia archaeon]|jgi:chemotaxis protein methyltransferase CheR
MSLENENFLEKIMFEKLKKQLREATDVDCEGYRPEYLKRRLEIRLRATNSKTYGDYARYLKANPKEHDLLLNDLTINYSLFFRDSDVFLSLKEKIFPEFFSSKTARIWSAGCATGEEPYSLAILANECKSRSTKDLQVTIYASDVDRDALAKAARGKYDLKSLQGVEQSLVDKYFAREGELFSVKDFVKQSVRFERHDLMTSPSHQNLDLVLCRNVMIYFSRESQQKIHMHFYDSLKEGGYLVIGKTEMLSGEPSKKFVCVDSGTRIYKKTKETIGFEKPTTLPVAYLK